MSYFYYTTLKENRKNNVDLINDVDECLFTVGSILNETFNTEKYLDKYDYSDFDLIEKDFSKKKLESIILKYLKKYSNNNTEMYLLRYKKYLFETLFVYDGVEQLLENNLLKASDVENIIKLCKKYNIHVEKEIQNENGFYNYYDLSDLKEKYFPCNFDKFEKCNDCGNCE